MPNSMIMNVANAILKLVAVNALSGLYDRITGHQVSLHFEPELGQLHDVVDVHGLHVTLDHHVEATFQVPDVTKVLAVPDLLMVYMNSVIVALAERVEKDLLALGPYSSRTRMVMRRLPIAILGSGAISEYAELDNFGIRVVMSYDPHTLSQQFTIDMLYGCAIGSDDRSAGS